MKNKWKYKNIRQAIIIHAMNIKRKKHLSRISRKNSLSLGYFTVLYGIFIRH